MARLEVSSFFTLFWYLIILRIILVCIPQTGYIHPDEFFQSVEVLAGKFLDVEYSPPWEFNSTFPIRSMTIPYFTIGMSYKFLRDINNLAEEYLARTLLTPYVILVVPRLLMCSIRKFHLLPSVRSIKCLMTLSFITPVILLSLFPHQEPRFLIPIIIPLTYVHGMTVLPEPETVIVEAPKTQLKDVRVKTKSPSFFLLKIWLIVNTLLMIFYGFLHQGGVYQATAYISKDLRLTPLTTENLVISYTQRGNPNIQLVVEFFLYEQGSENVSYILKKLHTIINVNTRNSHSKSKQLKVYLLISSSLEDQLNYLLGKQFLNVYLVETFYPHLSMEAFPDLTKYCLEIIAPFFSQNCTVLTYEQYLWKVGRSVGLSLYEVALNDM
ncbi:hypothetical protein NQ314_007783 [Rhamnusium bicolor]|uniref:Mannosyltransferase n=1 Tax=Rhamnusium bicolor TaxID=1586634 RepID=A0AAV8YJG0_9CUCU|nr:hypothetical protein NQ314_007783 [Rhamnusium bicolor]